MDLHSYHIFYFPFTWKIPGNEKYVFSERVSLDNVTINSLSNWENINEPLTDQYKRELFNEKNFFYPFVHPLLYDDGNQNSIIRHYERKEAYNKDIIYKIGVKADHISVYELKVRSICLNLYTTGVGILIFYLENNKYPAFEDILRINQFGRRVYPPFMDTKTGIDGTKDAELADFIAIEGLNGNPANYFENYTEWNPDSSWKPARFINTLILELSEELTIAPVIDDRMMVACWYGNEEFALKIAENPDQKNFLESDEWYRFMFVDGGGATCQNDDMKKDLLQKHTNKRWQKYGSLFGITRYSMVYITAPVVDTDNFLVRNFRTIYSRMVEMAIIQRASTLKFADEVTSISRLNDKNNRHTSEDISDFYKEYICFVNQVYFREITTQEQGIEIYDELMKHMRVHEQVKDLDKEIEELHLYSNLVDDKKQSNNLSLLTKIGALFIAPSLIASYYGMNNVLQERVTHSTRLSLAWVLGTFIVLSSLILWLTRAPKRIIRILLYISILIILLATFLLPFFVTK
jgi:hypothetical protein